MRKPVWTEYFAPAFIIFLFNLFFKLIRISAPSLWYDEIISVQDTLLDFGHIKHEAEWDKNPPFYHYVLWIWSKLFGISELSVKGMVGFFKSLSRGFVFLFLKQKRGFLAPYSAALVFSFSPYL